MPRARVFSRNRALNPADKFPSEFYKLKKTSQLAFGQQFSRLVTRMLFHVCVAGDLLWNRAP
jgi:hypothetical protein